MECGWAAWKALRPATDFFKHLGAINPCFIRHRRVSLSNDCGQLCREKVDECAHRRQQPATGWKNEMRDAQRGVPFRQHPLEMIVDVIINADAIALKGDLDSASRELSALIGRPTTTLAEAVQLVLPPA
jgi:hypothetical protein